MPPKGSRQPVSGLGCVARRPDDKHRATMWLDKDLEYGPERFDLASAQADLDKMRAGTLPLCDVVYSEDSHV